MNIKKFVTATTDHSTYYQFCGFMSQNMRNKFGADCKVVIAYITNKDDADERYQNISKFAEVIKIKPIPEIDIGIQAKVSRLWLASQSDEPCAIVDVDWLAIDENFFKQCFKRTDKENLGVIGSNAFYNTPDQGKFPMNMVHTHPDTFKTIINPRSLNYRDLLLSWNTNKFDGKESVFNQFTGFSDESLLRKMVAETSMQNNIVHNEMPSHRPYGFSSRLDRSNWHIDLNRLSQGGYIDSQPLRPLNENFEKVSPLLSYLGLDLQELFID